MLNVRGKTTPMGKRGHVLALASLTGARINLTAILLNSQVKRSACSNIITEYGGSYIQKYNDWFGGSAIWERRDTTKLKDLR